MARSTDVHGNDDLLHQLLAETLPECDEARVTDHLATCEECRRQFEVLAATEDWWAEVGQRLSRAENRRPSSPLSNDLLHDDEIHFTTDFAVDFLQPSDEPQSLGRLGNYEIEEVIGRGGMGIVLKGYQKELHRHVAVKVLSPHLATSGAARRRFAREAQATAAVVHPHVMAIHAVNASATLPYLVMPFVPCQSLQERIDRQGPFPVADILRIGMQTARGLAAAHAQGLVHRDVKPANILLETTVDRVLLTDFGLARAVDDATLTRTGIIAGTPQYMSPEQANGDVVDARSDLFSLGSVIYAMCTARPPFRAETTFGVLRRIRETSPRSVREINADAPEWLDRLILKSLSKNADDRFESANELADVLEQCLAHVQQPTSVPLPINLAKWERTTSTEHARQKWRNRRSRSLWLGGLTGLLTISTLITGWWMPSHQSPNTEEFISPQEEISLVADDHPGTGLVDSMVSSPPAWNEIHDQLDSASENLDQLEAEMSDLTDEPPFTSQGDERAPLLPAPMKPHSGTH